MPSLLSACRPSAGRRIATARAFLGVVSVAALMLTMGSMRASAAFPKGRLAAAPMARGTHVTTGIVESLTETELVIVRHGKRPDHMTFALGSTTTRERTIAAGTSVSVRYRIEGNMLVATAVTVRMVTK